MNHAGLSPLPERVAEAVRSFAEEALQLAPGTSARWERRAEDAREGFARLIGARPSEVAFARNTSDGLSLVAFGLDWRDGDNVVALEDEYPSNVYPWWALRRFGVATRMVPRPQSRFCVDDIRPWIDGRTRVLAVSAVDWQTGFRADLATLAALCRERGVLLVVDGIQAVGALRIDVRAEGIDCLAVGGHSGSSPRKAAARCSSRSAWSSVSRRLWSDGRASPKRTDIFRITSTCGRTPADSKPGAPRT